MKWQYLNYRSWFILIVAGLLTSCWQSDYTRLVKAELGKGIRKDSVLLGLNLGDTRDEFFGKCMDLNRQKKIGKGTGISVRYIFSDSTTSDTTRIVQLLFYPAFDSVDRINSFDMEYSYAGWSPWLRHLQSDSLRAHLVTLFEQGYGGNPFVTVELEGDKVPVKVDGNRRIMVFIEDPQRVMVKVDDILHPKFSHSITKESKEEVK